MKRMLETLMRYLMARWENQTCRGCGHVHGGHYGLDGSYYWHPCRCGCKGLKR